VSDDQVKVTERDRSGEPEEQVDKVAYELRRKLRFVRDAVLDDPHSLQEETMVARLESIGLLTRDEAHLSHLVLGDLRDTIGEWDERNRDDFLDTAWQFARRLGTEAFDRLVRQQLAEAHWLVADFKQPPKRRPDFLIMRDDKWAVIAARVADPPTTIDDPIARLRKPDYGIPGAARVVAIPDPHTELAEEPTLHADGAVLLVRLHHLLERPELVTGWPQL
jgi:hypothetical protein